MLTPYARKSARPNLTAVSISSRTASVAAVAFLALLVSAPPILAQSAYVRVNQAGYEAGSGPFRAYLMSEAVESGATYKV
ncbi:MAG: hypothetical protein WBS18_10085, partial [Candidatus Acidiferrales bacterium]